MERSRFYEGQKVLRPAEVLKRLEVNPEAHAEFRKAKANYDGGQVLGFIGGFLIGWPIGAAIAGNDPEWGLAAGGAAVILTAIPLSVAFKKHSGRALAIYNGDQPSARQQPLRVYFQFRGSGGALVVKM